MLIKDIIACLESFAPPAYQESYDNSGLLVGDRNRPVHKVLIALDVTEEVVQEAMDRDCGMIIAHHPLLFKGIKQLTGDTFVERSIIRAIQNHIAIYALHTNLDNVASGVNNAIGDLLGIGQRKILQPQQGRFGKLAVYVPEDYEEPVRNALFEAGAGTIGQYRECSFAAAGQGSFKPGEGTEPYTGKVGQRHYEKEVKLEVIFPWHNQRELLQSLTDSHPYEEVAYDLYRLENENPGIGSGMYGYLQEPVYSLDFLQRIKEKMGGVIRHTSLVKDQVQKIAWCGGSGSFLLPAARRVGADLFLTSDFKYHQFFEAENEIIIADVGHYENEHCTKALIASIINEKFPTFAVLLAETNTNPINYL